MTMKQCAGGLTITCTCDDTMSAAMLQNLCTMLAGGLCTCCMMMNGMVAWSPPRGTRPWTRLPFRMGPGPSLGIRPATRSHPPPFFPGEPDPDQFGQLRREFILTDSVEIPMIRSDDSPPEGRGLDGFEW